MPPLEERLIVWELKRLKISFFDELPTKISKSWEKYNQIQLSNYDSITDTNSLKKLLLIKNLDEGKQICIKKFLKTLKGNTSEMKSSIYTGFESIIHNWLDSLNSNLIIHMYENIRKKIH